jgi:hypothetical protein
METGMLRIKPQAFTLTLAVALLCACGAPGQPTANTSPNAATTGTATLACTSAGKASPSWPAAWTRSTSVTPIATATAAHDTFELTFDSGTPDFVVTPQSNAHFFFDSGRAQPIDLPGSDGVLIVLRGFRGDMANYAGPDQIAADGPLLLQVHTLGGSEGQVSWAAGLSRPGCTSVTATGSTLSFHFVASP